MNKPKAVGTAFETLVVRFLQGKGIDCERRALSGTFDKGDIGGIDNWCLEVKAHRDISLAGFMDEVAIEKANAKVPFGAAIVKRRGKNIADAYVVMPLGQFADLLQNGDW